MINCVNRNTSDADCKTHCPCQDYQKPIKEYVNEYIDIFTQVLKDNSGVLVLEDSSYGVWITAEEIDKLAVKVKELAKEIKEV